MLIRHLYIETLLRSVKSWLPSYLHEPECMGGYYWTINTMRPTRNDQHLEDDIFKRVFFNENVWISFKISLKFVPKGPIDNVPTLVQIMAWRLPGDKPLSEPMTHICVPRPQWVKKWKAGIFQDSFGCVWDSSQKTNSYNRIKMCLHGFPSQRVSGAKCFSISWRHHANIYLDYQMERRTLANYPPVN